MKYINIIILLSLPIILYLCSNTIKNIQIYKLVNDWIGGQIACSNSLTINNFANNIKIKDIHLKQLQKNKTTNTEKNTPNSFTKILSDSTEYDMGFVANKTIYEKNIYIKNIGDHIFFLDKLATSCECTSVSCDWKELHPRDSAIISVKFKTEKAGDFLRLVNIYGNIKEKELTLMFTGTVN